MSGNPFVSENRSRVFDRRANIKILRFRVVCGNEKESGWVLVVNTRRIHKTARAGWLEGLGQLSNLKRPEIVWQRYEIVLLQEADHFCFAAFICFQERFLIRRNVSSPFRIRISEFWIGQERLERAITREFCPPNHLYLCGVDRQK